MPDVRYIDGPLGVGREHSQFLQRTGWNLSPLYLVNHMPGLTVGGGFHSNPSPGAVLRNMVLVLKRQHVLHRA